MTVSVSFWAGEDFQIQDLSGSGIGLYGDSGFANSVRVGSYQGRSYITNGAGTTQGPEIDNVKYVNSGSGIIGQSGSGIGLKAIPNYLATLNIRVESDGAAIRTQTNQVTIYDRVSSSNPASGVTCALAQVIHPDNTQTSNGSGDSTWTVFTPTSTGQVLALCPSPGVSGLYAGNGNNGAAWSDTRHDHYILISASPDTVGSKTQFGLLFESEYL